MSERLETLLAIAKELDEYTAKESGCDTPGEDITRILLEI